MSWPANAGYPGDVFSDLTNKIVIARFMRATQFSSLACCQIGSPDASRRPMTFFGRAQTLTGWPAFAGHDKFSFGDRPPHCHGTIMVPVFCHRATNSS